MTQFNGWEAYTPKSLSRNNRSIFDQKPLTSAPLSPNGARGEWIRNYNPLSLGTSVVEGSLEGKFDRKLN